MVESTRRLAVMVIVGAVMLSACTHDSTPTDADISPPWSRYTWQTGDITATTGAPPANGPGFGAYRFEAQGTQHVIYASARDNHVHELWWNVNGWHTADLTASAGAAPASGPITGYALEAENTEHAIYTGVDKRIHELWFDTRGWHTGDLTATTDAPPPAEGAVLAGYAFEAQHTQHVIYISADNHIRELWFGTGSWHTGDLTVATGAVPAAAGVPPAAYPFEKQRTQHVVYAGIDGRLHELWSRGTSWHADDLTSATGAPPAQAIAGYALEVQGTQHAVYAGVDHRLYELWWSDGWHLGDLTAATGAPPAAPDGRPLGYGFEVQATQHVIYLSAGDGHLREIWWGPARRSAPAPP